MHSYSLLQRTLFERTLRRALDIVGDEKRLARRLRVLLNDLHAWLTGEERPPTTAFLTAVDIVVGAGDRGKTARRLIGSVADFVAERSPCDVLIVRPREPDDQKMFLTGVQERNVAYLALVVLPGLFVVLGVANWWRRR